MIEMNQTRKIMKRPEDIKVIGVKRPFGTKMNADVSHQ